MDCILHGVAKSQTRVSGFHVETMTRNRVGILFQVAKSQTRVSGFHVETMTRNRAGILFQVPFTLEADSEQSYDDAKRSKCGKHSQFLLFP